MYFHLGTLRGKRWLTKNRISEFLTLLANYHHHLNPLFFWLYWVFDAAWAFSSCNEGAYSLVVVHRFLMVAASLVAKH